MLNVVMLFVVAPYYVFLGFISDQLAASLGFTGGTYSAKITRLLMLLLNHKLVDCGDLNLFVLLANWGGGALQSEKLQSS
jgi:hypothetical protein